MTSKEAYEKAKIIHGEEHTIFKLTSKTLPDCLDLIGKTINNIKIIDAIPIQSDLVDNKGKKMETLIVAKILDVVIKDKDLNKILK